MALGLDIVSCAKVRTEPISRRGGRASRARARDRLDDPSGQPLTKTGMRLKRAIFIALAILLVAVLAWRFAPLGTRPAARSTAQAQVPVLAGTAETRSVPVYVDGLGSVQAFNTVTVKTRVNGQI